MTMSGPYSELFADLRSVLKDFRAGTGQLEDVQRQIWNVAQQVSSPEERDMRVLLQWTEGKLEILRFTMAEDEVFRAALDALRELENSLAERERRPA